MAMSKEEVKTLAGLPLTEAETRAKAKGSYIFILSEDGGTGPVLTKYDPNRVCVHLEKGKVIAAVIS
jgi:hypothetical protein